MSAVRAGFFPVEERRLRRKQLRRSRLAIAFVIAALPPLVNGQMLIEWDARGSYERSHEVAGGKFSELCAKLRAGDRVQWSYTSDRPLDFNIHYHEGKDVHYPADAKGSKGTSGVLAVTQPQDYCWMWTNGSASPATVQVVLVPSR